MQAKGFLKKPSPYKARELLNLSRNQLRIPKELLTGHCHLKGYPFTLGLVNSPKCDKCEQVSEMARPHMFFVNVMLGLHKIQATLVIIL
jgi:hypothetical protein